MSGRFRARSEFYRLILKLKREYSDNFAFFNFNDCIEIALLKRLVARNGHQALSSKTFYTAFYFHKEDLRPNGGILFHILCIPTAHKWVCHTLRGVSPDILSILQTAYLSHLFLISSK